MENSHPRSKKKLILVSLGSVLLVAVAAAGVTWLMKCPCDRIPGTYLVGEEVQAPVSDWSFANSEPLCQIEVGNLLPHSVNLNCMAVDGELFLSCAGCDGKHWSTIALENQQGRIRIGTRVYPVSLQRVTDPEILDAAWKGRADKLGREPQPRADGWWSFRLESI